MWDVDSDFAIDDLHFVAVPAPPILLVFAGGLALLGRGRRRRGGGVSARGRGASDARHPRLRKRRT
jgi:hypothetical protein